MSTKKCIYFFNLLTQLKETAKKNSYLSHYIFSRRSDNKKKKNPEDIFSLQKSTYIYILELGESLKARNIGEYLYHNVHYSTLFTMKMPEKICFSSLIYKIYVCYLPVQREIIILLSITACTTFLTIQEMCRPLCNSHVLRGHMMSLIFFNDYALVNIPFVQNIAFSWYFKSLAPGTENIKNNCKYIKILRSTWQCAISSDSNFF